LCELPKMQQNPAVVKLWYSFATRGDLSVLFIVDTWRSIEFGLCVWLMVKETFRGTHLVK